MRRNLAMTASAVALMLPSFATFAADDAAPRLQLAMMEMMQMGGGSMPQQGTGAMPMQNDNMGRMGAGQSPAQQMPGMAAPGSAGRQPGPGVPMNNDMMRMMQGMMGMGSGQQGMPQMPGMQSSPQQMPGMQGAPQQMPGGQGWAPPMSPVMPLAPGGMAPMDDDMMGMGGRGGPPVMGSSTARLEGRIAFLRAELAITPAQATAWDQFANSLRTGREHLDAARASLQDSGSAADPMARLEAYEQHLRERTEAIYMTRMAFSTLFAQLDDVQKRKATTLMLPMIGRF